MTKYTWDQVNINLITAVQQFSSSAKNKYIRNISLLPVKSLKLITKVIFLLTLTLAAPNNSFAEKPAGITQNENSYRYIVTFYSTAAGIDGKIRKDFLKFVKDYEAANGKVLNYETVGWGKEGEVDYCFKLSGLTTNEQSQFITDSKNILQKSNLVIISENSPSCRRVMKK